VGKVGKINKDVEPVCFVSRSFYLFSYAKSLYSMEQKKLFCFWIEL